MIITGPSFTSLEPLDHIFQTKDQGSVSSWHQILPGL